MQSIRFVYKQDEAGRWQKVAEGRSYEHAKQILFRLKALIPGAYCLNS